MMTTHITIKQQAENIETKHVVRQILYYILPQSSRDFDPEAHSELEKPPNPPYISIQRNFRKPHISIQKTFLRNFWKRSGRFGTIFH